MIAPKSLHKIVIPLPLREGVRGRVEALVIVMPFSISPPPHPSPWKGEGRLAGEPPC
jgi:hypothetical protein